MKSKDLFDNLFHGGIFPADKNYAYDDEYHLLYEEAIRLELETFAALGITPEQRAGFDKVLHAYKKVWEYQQVDYYKDGFCLGGRLAIAMMDTEIDPDPFSSKPKDDE